MIPQNHNPRACYFKTKVSHYQSSVTLLELRFRDGQGNHLTSSTAFDSRANTSYELYNSIVSIVSKLYLVISHSQ